MYLGLRSSWWEAWGMPLAILLVLALIATSNLVGIRRRALPASPSPPAAATGSER